MTTVAYRDGVMAADTMTTWGDTKTYGQRKVYVLDDCLVGLGGNITLEHKFLDWLRRGRCEPKPTFPKGDFAALVVYRDGRMEWWDETMFPTLLPEPYYAMGSGNSVAYGAMDAGADAETAVRIAIKRDKYTGGEVMTVRLSDLR